MSREYRARTFKSGNSVALRLPKALGVKEGMEMIVRESAHGFSVESAAVPHQNIDLTGIWGSIPDLRPLSSDRRDMEERKLDWDGKRLSGG